MEYFNKCIVKREYELDRDKQVYIYLYRPELYDEDFCCKFKIIGLINEIDSYAIGIDEIQSIILALTKIGSILYTSEEYKSGRLTWLYSSDLGLPIPKVLES